MTISKQRLLARLTPLQGASVDDLLRMPLSFDVWERSEDALLVLADPGQLAELERRVLSRVERVCTEAEFLARRQDALDRPKPRTEEQR
jgi:hypothetical protein